jgi:hypothetical protein
MAMSEELEAAVSEAATAFLRALVPNAGAETILIARLAMHAAVIVHAESDDGYCSPVDFQAVAAAITAVARDRFSAKILARPNLSPATKEAMASEFGRMLDRVLNEAAGPLAA